MERAGLDPKVHKNVKRKLLLSNAAIQDIKENMEKKAKQGPTFACKVIKKYKCVHSFSKAAGVSTKRTRKSVLPAKKRNTIKDQLRNTVLEFLEREDNSTLMPGKRDAKSIEGTSHKKKNTYRLHAQHTCKVPIGKPKYPDI